MAPPLLTRQQFNNTAVGKKPGASYGSYVNFVTKTRAARAARAASDPYYSYSQAMNRAGGQALGDVNASINAQTAAARANERLAEQQTERQAARAEAFSKALAGLSTPDAQQVQANYEGAADRMRLYGTGFSGAIGQDVQQQADAAKAAIAASTGGLGSSAGGF